jgi:ParB-like chromosome segregation protein Spo0J
MRSEKWSVKEISIDAKRLPRKALPKVEELMASIKQLGLLQPIGLEPDGTLCFGRRRFEAVKRLGWTRVDVRVLESTEDKLHYLRVQQDENEQREPLTPSEAADLARQLLPAAKEEAKARQTENLKKGRETPVVAICHNGETAEKPKAGAKARDVVAAAAGMSPRTMEKAVEVVEAADADPERNGDLREVMDAQSVDAAHKELKKRKAADAVGTELPEKCAAAFAARPEFVKGSKLLADLEKLIAGAVGGPAGHYLKGRLPHFQTALRNVRNQFLAGKPHAVCPYCAGAKGDCDCCKGCGWVPKHVYATSPAGRKR